MFIQTKIENEYQELASDRTGPLNPNPVDEAGAGDPMLVALQCPSQPAAAFGMLP